MEHNLQLLYNFEMFPEDYLKLSILLFFMFLYYLQLNKNKVLPFFFLNHFIILIYIFLSLFLIEKGIYLSELDRIGFNNNSFYIWSVFAIIFIIILNYSHSFSCGVLIPNLKPRLFIFIYFSSIVFTYLYVGSLDTSTHSKASVFAQDVGPLGMTVTMKILTYTKNLINIAFNYYLVLSRKKYFYILSFLYLLESILIVNSLSPLYSLLFIILSRFAIINRGFKLKPIHIILFVVFVSFRLYTRMENFGMGQSFMAQLLLFERFAGQGELFWVSIHESYQGNLSNVFFSFWDNFLSFRNAAINVDYGFGHFMFSVNPSVAKQFIDSGLSWTSGFPGINIYYYGLLLGGIIFVILTLFIMKLYQLYIEILLGKNVFVFIAYFIVFQYVVTDYYGMGESTRFNMRTVFYLVLFLLLYYGTIQDFFLKIFRNSYQKSILT